MLTGIFDSHAHLADANASSRTLTACGKRSCARRAWNRMHGDVRPRATVGARTRVRRTAVQLARQPPRLSVLRGGGHPSRATPAECAGRTDGGDADAGWLALPCVHGAWGRSGWITIGTMCRGIFRRRCFAGSSNGKGAGSACDPAHPRGARRRAGVARAPARGGCRAAWCTAIPAAGRARRNTWRWASTFHLRDR